MAAVRAGEVGARWLNRRDLYPSLHPPAIKTFAIGFSIWHDEWPMVVVAGGANIYTNPVLPVSIV